MAWKRLIFLFLFFYSVAEAQEVELKKILLLDEPSVGIQPSIIQQIGNSLKKLNAEEGITIFLVEQNLALIEKVVQRGYAMEKGKIVSELAMEMITDKDLLANYLSM